MVDDDDRYVGSTDALPLRAVKVAKSFRGIRALRGVSVDFLPGEVLALIGPNGAGKSTLLGTLTGQIRPDAGEVYAGATNVTGWPPQRASSQGLVARAFQATRMFDGLSAVDNIRTGAHRRGRQGILASLALPCSRRHRVDEVAIQEAFDRALDLLGLRERLVSVQALDEDSGLLRLVQIARTLAAEPSVLLLDEPTAGLDEAARDSVIHAILAMKGAGTTVGIVEHDLHVVRRVADRVIVLDQGLVIDTGSLDEVQASAAVEEAYSGQEAAWS